MFQRYGKKQIEVNADNWTPISIDADCDFFSLRCTTSDLLMRTNVDDASTEDIVSQGTQDGVTVGSGSAAGISTGSGGPYVVGPRFLADSALCFIKSVQPTAIVRLTWVL